ncbi:MAG: class I SAM-dependent methyltransferase [Flavobacteriales bacterium]|jgi:predicted O-methyltransferase YrrM|nr:class I SAM-dependent methyltransferase [Flavobacteriales bacterium]
MAFPTHQLRAFLRHLRLAGNRHSVHSPFVFSLVEEALRQRSDSPRFPDLEKLRGALLKDARFIPVTDLGAGSHRTNSPERRVRDIAKSALKPKRQAELLHRIARYFQPRTVLELGTSFGITTLYLARAAEQGQVITIEGSPGIHAIAEQNFLTADQRNIRSLLGSFDERLTAVLDSIEQLDLAFVDGHHAKEPTLRYFDQCLAKAHNDSIFIFDDIHWSVDMEEAWEAIQVHPQVTVTIDLFHFGIVFLRKEQQREHFRLRY